MKLSSSEVEKITEAMNRMVASMNKIGGTIVEMEGIFSTLGKTMFNMGVSMGDTNTKIVTETMEL